MKSNKKQVAIILPLYQKKLSSTEEKSIKSLTKYLSDYPIFSIGPKFCKNIKKEFTFIEFDSSYFIDRNNYSKLLLSSSFYNTFADFKYILIYQTDCLVLSSNLSEFCSLGYDYIGAPWFKDKNFPEKGFSRIGNGGLSLRKVSSFLRVLRSKHIIKWSSIFSIQLPDRPYWDYYKKINVMRETKKGIDWYAKNYSLNEDLFWSDRAKLFYPEFKIAPVEIGLKFAFEAHPKYCFEKNIENLPFGAHAWEKWDREFWEDWIGK